VTGVRTWALPSGGRGGGVAGGRVGEGGGVGAGAGVAELDDLQGADAVREDPEEVGEVPGDDAALALRAEEDHGLLGEGPAGTRVPEGGGAAGAVLAEEPVGISVEFGVAGPAADPVRGLLGGAEGAVEVEVDGLAVGVGDAGGGGVGAGGREAGVVAVGLGHVGTVTGRTDIRSPRKPVRPTRHRCPEIRAPAGRAAGAAGGKR